MTKTCSTHITLALDCDGTLYSNPEKLLAQFRSNKIPFLEKLGCRDKSLRQVVSATGDNKGKGFVNYLCAAAEIFKISVESAEKIWVDLLDYSFIEENSVLAKQLEDFLTLNPQNKIVIVTNNFRPHVFKVMQQLGFSDELQRAIKIEPPKRGKMELATGSVYYAKPSPQAFNCLSKYENVIFFDDNDVNVETANSLGFRSILVNCEEGVSPILSDVISLEL